MDGAFQKNTKKNHTQKTQNKQKNQARKKKEKSRKVKAIGRKKERAREQMQLASGHTRRAEVEPVSSESCSHHWAVLPCREKSRISLTIYILISLLSGLYWTYTDVFKKKKKRTTQDKRRGKHSLCLRGGMNHYVFDCFT